MLELERAGTLVGELKDAGNGKYALQASTEAYRLRAQDPGGMALGIAAGDRTWRTEFDATGRAESAVLPPDAWRNEQFVAPGAPRAMWLGVRMQLGA